MAAPTTGYGTATITNPSAALTDFSLMIDLSTMHADWWTEQNDADGTKGRAYKSDGTTELPCDWIDFDGTNETGELRVKFSGSLANSGTQTIRIYPPHSDNAAVAANATYGSDNAYDAYWDAYWPNGGGTDRTSNSKDGSAQGGVSVGGAVGLIGKGTDFDGDDDYITTTIDAVYSSGDTSLFAVAKADTLGDWEGINFSRGTDVMGLTTDDADHLAYTWDNLNHDFDGPSLATAKWWILGMTVAYQAVTLYAGDTSSLGSSTDSSPTNILNDQTVDGHTIGYDGFGTRFFDGILQHVSIHSADRVVAWVTEEYNQLIDNATFWGTWGWTPGAGGANMPLGPLTGIFGGPFAGPFG